MDATVGKEVFIKGQIFSRENLTIQGKIEGTIEVEEHRLTIAADGRVQADVTARDIDVAGSMEGKVAASDKVYVRVGASIVGDIRSTGIIVEDGAYIKGGVDLSQSGVAGWVPEPPAEIPEDVWRFELKKQGAGRTAS